MNANWSNHKRGEGQNCMASHKWTKVAQNQDKVSWERKGNLGIKTDKGGTARKKKRENLPQHEPDQEDAQR